MFGGRKMRCPQQGSAHSGRFEGASNDWSNVARIAAVAGALAASVTLLPTGALAVSGGGGKYPCALLSSTFH